jgi:hypothetical protein
LVRRGAKEVSVKGESGVELVGEYTWRLRGGGAAAGGRRRLGTARGRGTSGLCRRATSAAPRRRASPPSHSFRVPSPRRARVSAGLFICLGKVGRAWSWRRGTGRLAGRRRHPTSVVFGRRSTRGKDKGRAWALWDRRINLPNLNNFQIWIPNFEKLDLREFSSLLIAGFQET